MSHDPDLLDALERLPKIPWKGRVYRYVPQRVRPDRENTSGARWNPSEVAAIYTALERETAQAEFDHHLNSWSPRPSRGFFVVHTIEVEVSGLGDLRDPAALASAGITSADLLQDDWHVCQRVGAAAAWLNFGGLLVPSARRVGGTNLVIFTHRQDPNFRFDSMSFEKMLSPPDAVA